MESLTEANVDIIIPIVNKIVSHKTSNAKNGLLTQKCSRSLYLRLLLLFSRLKLIINSDDLTKLKKYRKFIIQMEIPKKFTKFVSKLLKSYTSKNISIHLSETIATTLQTDKSLRKFIISKLTLKDIQIFIHALHNKTTHLKIDNQPSTIMDIDEPITTPKIDIEPQPDNDYPMCAELDITSSSELTQYDVRSYDELNFNEEEKEEYVYDIINPIQVYDMPDFPLDVLNTSNMADDTLDDFQLKRATVRITPLDLGEYKKIDDVRYKIFASPVKINRILSAEERIFSSRKKYAERQRSPSRETISKLDLMRNIYDSENEEIGSSDKFFVLNESVSVLINIEDSPKKSEAEMDWPVFSRGRNAKRNRKSNDEIETKQFYQTKLNFQIQKNKMNVNSALPVINNKLEATRKEVKPVKESKKSKKCVPKNRSYNKVDYKSMINQDYKLRTRSKDVAYMEPPDIKIKKEVI